MYILSRFVGLHYFVHNALMLLDIILRYKLCKCFINTKYTFNVFRSPCLRSIGLRELDPPIAASRALPTELDRKETSRLHYCLSESPEKLRMLVSLDVLFLFYAKFLNCCTNVVLVYGHLKWIRIKCVVHLNYK